MKFSFFKQLNKTTQSDKWLDKFQIKTLLRTKKLPRNIFIKIDTQGYEDKVIAGGQNILQKSSLILIELSFQRLYKGQKLFHEIYTKLHNIGFLLSGFRNQIILPLDGSILQAHGFFIHKDYINLL